MVGFWLAVNFLGEETGRILGRYRFGG